jgi:hypothetical protein
VVTVDNNFPNLNPGQPNSPQGAAGPEHFRAVLILSLALAITIILGILFSLHSGHAKVVSSSNTPQPGATSTPHPSASVSASNPVTPAPTPTQVSTVPSQPDYSGFDSLINIGLSSDQQNDAEYAFVKYGEAKNMNITDVTIDPNSVTLALNTVNSSTDTASFNVTINDQDVYIGKLNFSGLTAAELILTNPQTGAQVYDSGTIDVYNGIGDN